MLEDESEVAEDHSPGHVLSDSLALNIRPSELELTLTETTHVSEPGNSLRPRVGLDLALQVDVVPLLDLLQPHGGAQPQGGRVDEVDVEGVGGLHGGVR